MSSLTTKAYILTYACPFEEKKVKGGHPGVVWVMFLQPLSLVQVGSSGAWRLPSKLIHNVVHVHVTGMKAEDWDSG